MFTKLVNVHFSHNRPEDYDFSIRHLTIGGSDSWQLHSISSIQRKPDFFWFLSKFCANFPTQIIPYPILCYPLHHYTWLKHWPNNFKIDRLKSYGAQLFLGFDHSRPLPRSFSTGFRHFLNKFWALKQQDIRFNNSSSRHRLAKN